MDTAQLKAFATKARLDLMGGVGARLAAVLAPASAERVERARAVEEIERLIQTLGGGSAGRDALVDRVAYTWFNRLIALRFMDANGYTGVGVVSPPVGRDAGQPEILADAKRGMFDSDVVGPVAVALVTSLLNNTRRSADPQGEAYGVLLAEYCRHWNKAMPFMFEREGDYTELLMPADLLAVGSVMSRAISVLTPEVCKDVEVIGWLYQFYIADRKDEVFAAFKKGRKAGAAEIPAATQLFTPDWIVRYLVENSLGRLWMLNRPASRLAERMEYFIPPVDEGIDFAKVSSPEELTILDPACGSGHMLTYAFDLLYAIYEEEGYAATDIPSLILEKNLYGIEIDRRAGSLAGFALAMKARSRQRTFLGRSVVPNVCSLEAVTFTAEEVELLHTAGGDLAAERTFWLQLENVETFGSLIKPDRNLWERLRAHVSALPEVDGDLLEANLHTRAKSVILQAAYLSNSYHIVVANPPYMGAARMGSLLSGWLKTAWSLGRAGLDIAFWERSLSFLVPGGRAALITMQSWMFLATYNDFRAALLRSWTIESALHLGPGAFPEISGEVVGTVAAVMSAESRPDFRAVYLRLIDREIDKEEATKAVARGQRAAYVFSVSLTDLASIPRTPIAYWMGPAERRAFTLGRPVKDVARSGNGLTTSDNDRFLRYWWEVSVSDIELNRRADGPASPRRWHPINKAGGYRRWAGNREYVIDWANDGQELYDMRPASTVRNANLYFRESVSWSDIVTGDVSFRYFPEGWMFDASANSMFPTGDDVEGLLSFANSSFAVRMAPLLNPGLHFKLGDMGSLPYLKRSDSGWQSEVRELVSLAAADWDSIETALAFERPPLLDASSDTPERLDDLVRRSAERERALTRRVYELEVKNDREIADQYGLNGDYATCRTIHDVSLIQNPWRAARSDESEALQAQGRRAIEDLVSFAVGCMFGRFSLDRSGLILANKGDTLDDYLARVPSPSLTPDKDNVIPVVDGDWFEDDIVARFRQFLRVAFGEKHFAENLRFVTDVLGVRDLRDYFVRSFYKDHVQRYKKRPIYWLFSSPKGSFSALIYMHRYTPSTVSTVLNEYLREFRAKLDASRHHHERLAAGGGTPRDVAGAQKEAERLRKVLLELDEYEHDVLYPLAAQQLKIDLDDGVKANYPKFGMALKPIPGLQAADD